MKFRNVLKIFKRREDHLAVNSPHRKLRGRIAILTIDRSHGAHQGHSLQRHFPLGTQNASTHRYFPTEPNAYKYYGAMFVNCKSTEEVDGFRCYVLEVSDRDARAATRVACRFCPKAAPTPTLSRSFTARCAKFWREIRKKLGREIQKALVGLAEQRRSAQSAHLSAPHQAHRQGRLWQWRPGGRSRWRW